MVDKMIDKFEGIEKRLERLEKIVERCINIVVEEKFQSQFGELYGRLVVSGSSFPKEKIEALQRDFKLKAMKTKIHLLDGTVKYEDIGLR